ncbi:MAG: radical SAM family heme chaperone HemW [Clostridiales bacterium]|nr:radical SAM family heme chaperone HemW [Clostridiales bacterium]
MELYIHLPYCRQKCRYCDFASYAGQEGTMAAYVDALLREAEVMAATAQGKSMQTAYIGGGTPSTLPAPLLRKLLTGLRAHFTLPSGIEFTSEANPGTLTPPWLEAALDGGVNRLSLGMQAYQPELLALLGRIHSFEEVKASVHLARRMGVKNLSVDLMFGLPGQTVAMWRETLDAALSLGVEHISCYGLIPEDGTPLKRDLDADRLALPDEEDERRMYDDALRILSQAGFEQYEISNFAKPGKACQHNIGYWQRTSYIGLGTSAATFLPTRRGGLRLTNPSGIRDYIAMVDDQAWRRRDRTSLMAEDARFESLMLGLRMTQGISEAEFAAMHGLTLDAYCGNVLRAQAQRGLLVHQDGRWALTRRGMDVQNAILVEILEATDQGTD